MRAAVFGATGPIGRRVTAELLDRGVDVVVVSRSAGGLEDRFGHLQVERRPADLEDRGAARDAARGCDLVIHAVGLPATAFERHLPIARNAVAACGEAEARPFLVSSYWSYGPGEDEPMPEARPRAGDSEMAAIREREEEIFLKVDGAVARLPDFYGPEAGTSVLNDALADVVAGTTVRWPGDADARRDFIHYADAGRLLVDLALTDEAYGRPWNVPGSGARPPRELLARAAQAIDADLDLRPVGRWLARLAAIFDRDVRAFLDVMPLYEAPVILDTSRIRELLGEVRTTSYEEGLPATLKWIEGRGAGTTP